MTNESLPSSAETIEINSIERPKEAVSEVQQEKRQEMDTLWRIIPMEKSPCYENMVKMDGRDVVDARLISCLLDSAIYSGNLPEQMPLSAERILDLYRLDPTNFDILDLLQFPFVSEEVFLSWRIKKMVDSEYLRNRCYFSNLCKTVSAVCRILERLRQLGPRIGRSARYVQRFRDDFKKEIDIPYEKCCYKLGLSKSWQARDCEAPQIKEKYEAFKKDCETLIKRLDLLV